ncbi:tripartite tricarboxylate transporter substrate binding protein [Roseiarcaceae bacterium H3SJ34-1]|uniref:Bug family tripartite tricarboxylate transporter substrate binding protein n=1 Tax=Terripilifer ovatus TaxID=3032367 RepID=UPI003AB98958|nr:tripartite tricarboxylate transporter substrate binding protein [Roseiarcaceae bacterium H3SJ34-1]
MPSCVTRVISRKFAKVLAAMGLTVFQAAMLHAQDAYPTRPIVWVVPYAAGAPADIAFRKIAEGMTAPLGATIVVQNRPGAAATIGTTEVAKARPDGYTILATLNDPLVSLVALMDPLPYDPAKDFTFITKLTQSKAAMIAGPHIKARTLRELIDEAKAMPDGMAYGSFGVGSFPHIIMEALGRRTGAKFVNVNYRGSPQAIQELLSGQIGVTFGAAAAMQYIKEGKIKLIAQLGDDRGLLSDVPTFAESGFNDVLLTTPLWSGLVAPAGTPKAAVEKLVAAAKVSLERKDVQDFLVAIAFERVGNSPEEFAAQWRKEYDTIPAAIRSLGITAN